MRTRSAPALASHVPRVVALVLTLIFVRAAPPPLTGVATDTLGRVVAGVEILVTPDRAGAAVAATRTDELGRFAVASLSPGIYRVAALKSGYVVFLGRVNTQIRSSVELILRPLPGPGEPGGETTSRDRVWALRLPARGPLRDEDDRTWSGFGVAAATTTRPTADRLDGGLEQTFRFGDPFRGAAGPERGVQGSETRLRLGATLGERSRVGLLGRRESVDAEAGARGSPAARGASASDVQVQWKYDASADSRLSVRSFYSSGVFTASDRAPGSEGEGRAIERQWGWDASWSVELDPESRLDVRLGYRDAEREGPRASLQPARGRPDADSPIDPRRPGFGAAGRYESIAAPGHRIEVAVEAGRLDEPGRAVADDLDRFERGLPRRYGRDLRFRAEDTWRVSGRSSVVYGVGGYAPLDDTSATPALVPRVGGAYSGERLQARAVVAYFGGGGPAAPPGAAVVRAESRRFGYEAEAQVPLVGAFSLRASFAAAPKLHDGLLGGSAEGTIVAPVFVTDGNAAARESSVGIERNGPRYGLHGRFVEGSAAGALSVGSFVGLPWTVLADERIRYHSLRGGARVLSSGTGVTAEWREVTERSLVGSHGTRDRRSLDVRFSQEVARRRAAGAGLRLLVACRAERARERDSKGLGSAVEATRVREVRAGFAVAF